MPSRLLRKYDIFSVRFSVDLDFYCVLVCPAGLTGLEVLGDGGSIIPVEPQYLQCSVLSPDIYRCQK
jgi:hypothetical protein